MKAAAKPASTAALSRANREAILAELRRQGPMSRPDLGDAAGLSPATVNRLVNSLIEQGLIRITGRRSGTGGRPSVIVELNQDAVYVGVISVEARVIRSGLCNLNGDVLEPAAFPIPDYPSAEQSMDYVTEIADNLVRQAAKGGRNCVALGVSVPGVVDAEGCVDWAPALDWRQFPLGELLSRQLGLPVRVENDANALALAEYHHGVARGAEGLVALAMDEGIGLGVMIDGRLFRGSRAAAGEVGYMLLSPNALRRLFPGYGDLEQRVGSKGITSRAQAAKISLVDERLAISDLFALAMNDEAARRLAASVLDDMALALANVCVVLDPTVVVIGGTIGGYADLVSRGMVDRLTGRIPHLPQFIGPSFGSDAMLIGVGGLAFEAAGSLLALFTSADSRRMTPKI